MSRVRLVRLSTLAFVLALLVPTGAACTTDPSPVAGQRAVVVSSTAGGRTLATSTRVLAISVDGLNPDALTKLGRAETPSFHRLMGQGASTLNARTEYEQTVTLPNHTGMLTGRRIERAKGGHGVTWNDDVSGTTVHGAAGHRVASVFSRVHQAGGTTALFSTKSKFSLFKRSWPQGIDEFLADERHGTLLKAVRADLVEDTKDFTFLHVSLPDVTGHASGFMGEEYLDAVRRTDHQLGTLLRVIDQHPALAENLDVILTADHGGKGAGHAAAGRRYNFRVPFMVWGPGVSHADLYDLNPDYREPGRKRPTYAGKQPVRNGDLANLAADLLGLGPVKGSELDTDQDLDVG